MTGTQPPLLRVVGSQGEIVPMDCTEDAQYLGHKQPEEACLQKESHHRGSFFYHVKGVKGQLSLALHRQKKQQYIEG
ncbi:hypothetical protein SCG7086_AY_00150 [Chlamydiales bacterium SCGC AG-110-P3]|nr:hypothetical protein SCG7086_AY_00150 [Chlamydiales bacterium SCGC AG-110-P3]